MKDLKISRELLRAVLKIDIKDVSIIGSTLNYTILNHETEEDGELVYIDLGQNINIYEFSFKCKEWLKNKVSNLCSGFDNGHRSFCHIENLNTEDRFYEDSEVEAIIKACEWILSEVSK